MHPNTYTNSYTYSVYSTTHIKLSIIQCTIVHTLYIYSWLVVRYPCMFIYEYLHPLHAAYMHIHCTFYKCYKSILYIMLDISIFILYHIHTLIMIKNNMYTWNVSIHTTWVIREKGHIIIAIFFVHLAIIRHLPI